MNPVPQVERGDFSAAASSAGSQGSALLAGVDPRTKLALEVRGCMQRCTPMLQHSRGTVKHEACLAQWWP